jgi:hypothetical protein
MAYAYQTLANAVADLQARLFLSSDSSQQLWTSTELQAIIVEALREFSALTSFWRGEMSFPLVKGTVWYDLTAQSGSLRPLTVLDNDLVQAIECHLLEPPTAAYPLTWTGSAQFNAAEIVSALQGARDEVLSATGCILSRSLLTASTSSARTTLADTAIDIRRVAWIPTAPTAYSNTPLSPSDTRAEDSFDAFWSTKAAQPPSTYRRSTQPPLTFDVDTLPPVAGSYEVLVVLAGSALLTSASSVLGIPDDWSWVAKWGALAELLGRSGFAQDALRAQYAQRRFEEGQQLMLEAPALLSLRLNGLPVDIDAVQNGDRFDAGWQSAVQGPPGSCYVAGGNLIGFGPTPDLNSTYTAIATVVQNAPVTGTNIQIGRDDYDAIIGEAEHIALFKLGGDEFASTMPLHDAFLGRAALYNSKLKALGTYTQDLYDTSAREEEVDPIYSNAKPGVAGG